MDEIRRILAKESLDDTDINILMKNKGLLDQDALVRLGLATAPVKEPVVVEESKKEAPAPIKVKRAKK